MTTESQMAIECKKKQQDSQNPTESDKNRHLRHKFEGNFGTRKRKELMAKELVENNFHIGKACKQVGICRDTHNTWIKTDPKYKKAIWETNEYWKDEFEALLRKKAYEGETSAIIFFLKTKGRDRGYGEKQEEDPLEQKDNKLEIEMIEVIKYEDRDGNLHDTPQN